MKHYNRVLTIAGSDSGGGAGIQADLKTITMLGCYGMTAITALTAQNTQGVQAIHSVPPEFIAKQLHSVLSDIGVDAIKIGMLANVQVIERIGYELKRATRVPIVLDPVMVSTTGDLLFDLDAYQALKELAKISTLITPNMREASFLLDSEIQTESDMEQAAKALCDTGIQATLVKGGHLGTDQSPDVLYIRATKELHWFNGPRIQTGNTHGTGCSLSSAIAANLAQGYDLVTAISRAKRYLTKALEIGSEYLIGQGYGPIAHFYELVQSQKTKLPL